MRGEPATFLLDRVAEAGSSRILKPYLRATRWREPGR
jgi:hypothetical protein